MSVALGQVLCTLTLIWSPAAQAQSFAVHELLPDDLLANIEDTPASYRWDVDTDGDGVFDAVELDRGTDPHDRDTDDDLLPDGVEITVEGTDPNRPDTDGDGVGDGDEVLRDGTDPLSPVDRLPRLAGDTDGDGLTDEDEAVVGTDPELADSDGDRLDDGQEVLALATDPLDRDTDADGLADGDEALDLGTDPLDSDSDDGGVDDGQELTAGTSPLDAADDADEPMLAGDLAPEACGCATPAGSGSTFLITLLCALGLSRRPRATR